MCINFNKVLVFSTIIFFSASTYSQIHQCEIDGKVVYQQLPCPIEVVTDTGCDENYDYSVIAQSIEATFDDRYCYYLQINDVDSKEKERLMQVYKEKREEAQQVVDEKAISGELDDLEENSNFVKKNKLSK